MSTGFDGPRLRQLRLASNLSSRALAKALGVSSTALGRLEQGQGFERLTIGFVIKAAQLLGTTPTDLLTNDLCGQAAAPDDAKLEAAIQRADKRLRATDAAEAFEWPLARVYQAAEALRARLTQSGTQLVYQKGCYALRSAAGMLTPDEESRVSRRTLAERGLRRSEAIALRRLVRGQIVAAHPKGGGDKVAIVGSLTARGLVVTDGNVLTLTEAVRFSLAIEAASP